MSEGKQIEKIEKKKIAKTTNRGKPPDLKRTRLDAPDIWTNKLESSEIIKFLAEEGRHIFLHQAGKHSSKQTTSSIVIPFKGFYDRAEEVAQYLFSDRFVSKRCLVYFFRLPDQSPLHNQVLLQVRLKNQQHALILQYIQDLISPSFLEDLIHILNSEANPNEIAAEFLKQKKSFREYSEIVRNMFIKHIIEQMKSTGNDDKFSKDDEKTDEVYKRKIQNEFFKFLGLEETKSNIVTFIEKIVQLFQQKSVTQYDQNDNVHCYHDYQQESSDDQNNQSNQFSCGLNFQNIVGTVRFN